MDYNELSNTSYRIEYEAMSAVPVCSVERFADEFGSLTDLATEVLVKFYPMMKLENGAYYYTFDLEKLFSEPVDLFSVDSSMVSDMFVVNSIFMDENINTDITMTLAEVVQWEVEYDPVTPSGDFWLTFADIRRFYGEEKFDKDMDLLFPKDYASFKEYFLE